MRRYLFVLGLLFPMLAGVATEYEEFRRGLARSLSPLEAYLEEENVYHLYGDKFAGHITDAQKLQMNAVLASYSGIKSVGEIGLNFGHSAENFFSNCKQIEKYYSFDINFLPEVVEYFRVKYKTQFHFVHGDSMVTVPQFHRYFPTTKLDLIFIDGAHSYNHCLKDILNMRSLAHPGTHLWIDDYYSSDVFDAVQRCEKVLGIIKVLKVHVSDFKTHAERCWVEARYLFPE